MPKFYTDPPKGGKANIFDVKSKSKEGVFYKFRIMPDGEIKCGCPYNAITSNLCSHIREYLNLEKNQKVPDISGNTVGKGKFANDFPF